MYIIKHSNIISGVCVPTCNTIEILGLKCGMKNDDMIPMLTPISEERDDTLNIFPVINHAISPIIPSSGTSNIVEPIAVATPFPPLKFRYGL